MAVKDFLKNLTSPGVVSGGLEVYDYLKTQDTAREGAKEARQAAEKGIATTKEYLDPFAQAGATATQDYLKLLEDPSSIRRDPGYAFQQQEQQKAIQRSAAAGGQGVLSGATLATLQQRSGDLASQSYDQALNRRLALVGPGQQAGASASGTIAELQGQVGQAAIDRETLQMLNRGQTISGITGMMEAMRQPTAAGLPSGRGGGIVDKITGALGGAAGDGGGGVPVIGDWSLSDIPDAISSGAHEVGDFFEWMKDPNTSVFDPSTWELPSFEGIADYSVNDFFGDLGFL